MEGLDWLPTAPTQRPAALADEVIASAKGWYALGAMDSGERSQALDLLGFTSQLVFSTFSLGLFALSEDLDLVDGGTAAHNRMTSDSRYVPLRV